MTDTGFRPAGGDAATAGRRPDRPDRAGRRAAMLRGVVHDPRSRALGGVAGHAGLFGTADDLAVFAQMLLDGGSGRDGQRDPRPADRPGDDRPRRHARGPAARAGLGRRHRATAPRAASCSARRASATPGSPARASGSTPRPRRSSILLTSRLHPDGKAASPTPLRRRGRHARRRGDRRRARSSTAVRAARPAPRAAATRSVDCGIDVLVRDGLRAP